jgi:hypothetical protein
MCWLKSSGADPVVVTNYTSGTKLCNAGLGTIDDHPPTVPLEKASHLDVAFDRFSVLGPNEYLQSSAALEQDIVMQESTDSGVTWGPVHIISRTKGSRDGMPSIVRQKDGCLLCVFEGFGGTYWGHFTVRGVRSCDDGKTWVKQNIYPQPSNKTAHAPTVALLSDGRAAVSSYDESHNLQLQFSEASLVGTAAVRWSRPVIEVPAPAYWPDVFADTSGQLFVVYQVGNSVHVAGPVSIDSIQSLWI